METPRSWACSLLLAAAALQGAAQGVPSPDDGLAHLAAGRALQLRNLTAEALLEYANPAVARTPLWECGAFWRAQILVGMGRRAEAKPLYEALFKAPPSPSYRSEAAAFLADEAESAGDKAAAAEYAQVLCDASPNDPAPRARLAGLLEDLGRSATARFHAQWLWTRTPSAAPSAAFFKARPQWRAAFADLPTAEQLQRLRSLAAEGDFKSLGNELPRFQAGSSDEAAWAVYLKGRLAEGNGRAAEAVKLYASVVSPPDARWAAALRLAPALAKSGLGEAECARVEKSLIALPDTFEGRSTALVVVLKWRIRQPNDARATVLAEALLTGDAAQTDACEYLYSSAWDKWLAGERGGAERLWRVLMNRLPTDSDYRHAAAYALYRLQRMSPNEAADFKALTLKEDRYGYFGYRLRRAAPPRPTSPMPAPPEPAADAGSHLVKAKLLLSAGLASDSLREFQMALDGASDPAAKAGLLWALARAKEAAADYAGSIRTARILYPRVFNENGDALPLPTWRLLYPSPFREPVRKAAEASGLPYLLACSVIRQESLWDPDAVSRSGARGLMQLMPATAANLARRYALAFDPPSCYADPAWNTRAGCAYLQELISRYHGRLEMALAAYNAGPGRVDDWTARAQCPKDPDLFIESIPFKETRSYVRRILLNCWEYSRLYGDFPAPLAPGAIELSRPDAPPPA